MQDLTPMTPDEVKAFRSAMGWSQAALAKAAGVTNQAVEAWEKNGAKGYLRYVFAALGTQMKPWAGRPVGDRIDYALEQVKNHNLSGGSIPLNELRIELSGDDFNRVFSEPVPNGPMTARPANGLPGEYRFYRLTQTFTHPSRLVWPANGEEVSLAI